MRCDKRERCRDAVAIVGKGGTNRYERLSKATGERSTVLMHKDTRKRHFT